MNDDKKENKDLSNRLDDLEKRIDDLEILQDSSFDACKEIMLLIVQQKTRLEEILNKLKILGNDDEKERIY